MGKSCRLTSIGVTFRGRHVLSMNALLSNRDYVPGMFLLKLIEWFDHFKTYCIWMRLKRNKSCCHLQFVFRFTLQSSLGATKHEACRIPLRQGGDAGTFWQKCERNSLSLDFGCVNLWSESSPGVDSIHPKHHVNERKMPLKFVWLSWCRWNIPRSWHSLAVSSWRRHSFHLTWCR